MNFVNRVLRILIFIFTSLLVIIVGVGVFFRYVLHSTLHWATELPVFLFIWIVFLGGTVAFKEKLHVKLSFFVDKLPHKIRKMLDIVIFLLFAGFFVFILITGVEVVMVNMGSKSEATKIPYGIVYICIPLSSLLMLIHTLEHFWKLFK